MKMKKWLFVIFSTTTILAACNTPTEEFPSETISSDNSAVLEKVISEMPSSKKEEKNTNETEKIKDIQEDEITEASIEKKEKQSVSLNEKENENKDTPKETQHFIPATAIRIVDGDTIEVKLSNGNKETLRLLLVDTPETVHPSKPVMPFGPEASKYAKETLLNKGVELYIDVSERDKYGRLLVYLHVDGIDFNKSLIEKGLARVAYVWAPNTSRADEYFAAQKVAQNKAVGIWSIENYATNDGEGSFNYDEPSKEAETTEEETNTSITYSGPYDPFGPDKDCGDFSTHDEAQAFFIAAGGPEKDPHRLDGSDNDGLACESLP